MVDRRKAESSSFAKGTGEQAEPHRVWRWDAIVACVALLVRAGRLGARPCSHEQGYKKARRRVSTKRRRGSETPTLINPGYGARLRPLPLFAAMRIAT